MKKYLLSFALVMMSLVSFAQTNYEKIMTEKISKIENCKTAEEFQTLANDFQRIADKESTKWQPNYYAALSYIQKGRLIMREGKTQGLDEAADQAQKYVDSADNLEKDNSEIHLLQKMIYSLKMMVNPQERYMTFGMKAQEELNLAEKLNPNNPRVILIKAEDTYFTPEQYGGSKTKGIEMFKLALEKFNSFKPKTSLDPHWGKSEAEYFISSEAGK
ncbi:hypothetical protein CHRY9390_01411 [Chryseobacterium aquaeductus]|uniref:Tetratricopeptide repeat protein n=1 Tax=Chryseobacterium aquaeductus TaxID=2675056 RepID=A0A9N8MGH9_9FLAO|nr:hypothetical protein [Chryseobacterium aquaeductus]CAA7330738.1 hypothetical protein CHRY9390_01411 [Chryseobacterium potabilaquae]CAD7805735.1 hypothetical protein CHRY9390_01411 [Chryseobacterium aquaeductus]